MLGSGVPLPKILNIDFSNADIDVLEVRGDRVLFRLPTHAQKLGGGREGKGRVGNRGFFLQNMGLREQETKLLRSLK